jgi:limonene-1,2-epoxide hydrolase
MIKEARMKSPKEIVSAYWQAMNSNDFFQASICFAENYQCYWPQSSELITGREHFAHINTAYPVCGKWRFDVNSIIAEGNIVVTDVSVRDDVINCRVITFHKVENGKIAAQKEFWPDDFSAPDWRSEWVKITTETVFSETFF